MSKEVLVIGGGASGMMAAISAAREGARVTILEGGDRLGRKLGATGNGKCNFTNTLQEPGCYHSRDPLFPWAAISSFTSSETIRFFLELGLYSKSRNGYMYPHCEQAKAVIDVLRNELTRLGVKIHLEAVPAQAVKNEDGFQVTMDNGYMYRADALILSTGSAAGGVKGTENSARGYDLARSFGHSVIHPIPSLVPLIVKESFIQRVAGIRIDGAVTIRAGSENLATDRGELQFIKTGISGIPVFQVSGAAGDALAEGMPVTAILDFMPDFSKDTLLSFLRQRVSYCPSRKNNAFFTGLFPDALSEILLKKSGISSDDVAGSITEAELLRMVSAVKEFTVSVTGEADASASQVIRGGIDTNEVDPFTMESHLVNGLCFCGEILDVDGKCGGYNLQWAWSSGHLAGISAAKGA